MEKGKPLRTLILMLAGVILLAGVCLQHKCEAQTHGIKNIDVEEYEEDLSFLEEDDAEHADPAEEEEEEEEAENPSVGEQGEGLGVGEQDVTDEKDVVVLGSGNISEFLGSHRYVLLEFYAPWCGHCQALAPQYAEAATALKEIAAVAKVDATVEDELTREYEVEGFPALFFFIDGVRKEYSGGRTRDEIVSWVQRKTGPSVYDLYSKKIAEAIIDSQNTTIVIALLNSLKGSETEEYTSAARQFDDILFLQTDSAEVAKLFNFSTDVKRPALLLLKLEHEKVSWFDGPFKRDAIHTFVINKRLPLVTTFNKPNSALIFGSPIKKQIILFTHDGDYHRLMPLFMKAAEAMRGKFVFVHVDLGDPMQGPGIMDFFGLNGEKAAVMGYETKDNGRKFLLEGEITLESVKAFGEEMLLGKLRAYLRSERLPAKNDGDVKIVVGLNFDDIVLDETKDVLLEIYAPWCGHCQALEPTWDKLANGLRGVESLVIAKIDGTSNEHPRIEPEGFPTILFFPAGKKDQDPIVYEGDRTAKELFKFLRKEATIPFRLPKALKSEDVTPPKTSDEKDVESTSTRKSGEPSIKLDSTTQRVEHTTEPLEPIIKLAKPVEPSFESEDFADLRKDEL